MQEGAGKGKERPRLDIYRTVRTGLSKALSTPYVWGGARVSLPTLPLTSSGLKWEYDIIQRGNPANIVEINCRRLTGCPSRARTIV